MKTVKNILKEVSNNGIKCILVNSNNSITIFIDEADNMKAGVHYIATLLKEMETEGQEND